MARVLAYITERVDKDDPIIGEVLEFFKIGIDQIKLEYPIFGTLKGFTVVKENKDENEGRVHPT